MRRKGASERGAARRPAEMVHTTSGGSREGAANGSWDQSKLRPETRRRVQELSGQMRAEPRSLNVGNSPCVCGGAETHTRVCLWWVQLWGPAVVPGATVGAAQCPLAPPKVLHKQPIYGASTREGSWGPGCRQTKVP